jgi:hypothetical protein
VGPTGHVIATDVAADYLDTLRARARAAGLTNIETRLVDPTDLGLDPGTLDGAVLLHVFPYLPNASRALATLSHDVRAGGFIAIADAVYVKDSIVAAANAAGLRLVREVDSPALTLLIYTPG